MNEYKLESGTVVKINGVPVELKSDAIVLSATDPKPDRQESFPVSEESCEPNRSGLGNSNAG